MRCVSAGGPLVLAAALCLGSSGAALARQQPAAPTVVAHTGALSGREAALTFELSNGEQLTVSLRNGAVRVGPAVVGEYRSGGSLEQSWRALVATAGEMETADLLAAARALRAVGLDRAEETSMGAVRDAVRQLAAGEVVVPALAIPPVPEMPPAQPDAHAPHAEHAPVVAPAPVGPPGVRVEQSVRLDAGPSLLAQIVGAGSSLLGTFVALAFMGLGILFFAPRQLEVVSDMVWHSFGRSFLAGLFAQPLVIPVFGAMIAGLVLTVVGILVIPFAVVAFLVGLLLAIAGGYVAIARTVGEIFVRRWKRRTGTGPWVPFTYILYGLGGLLAIWIPAVVLGWIPVAGMVFVIAAALLTWILATAGFGAMLITRAGIRGTFVRRLDQALTDEHFWPLGEVTSPGGSGARASESDA